MPAHDDLLERIQTRVPHPATARELIRLLDIPREERRSFERRLDALVEAGRLVLIRGKHYGLADRMDLVVGRLEGHEGGYGFVVPERRVEGLRGDVYVAAPEMHEAMHGDRVVVRIEHRRSDGRADGRIVQILERGRAVLVGRYEEDRGGVGYVVPFDRRVTADVHVPPAERGGARSGDMVTVAITRWPGPTRGPLGRVVEVLGDIDAPGVDVAIIMLKHGIPDAHGGDAVSEAAVLGGAVRAADIAGRTDFRDVTIVTIDGEDARDFDDAISIERLKNGNYWLGVHIADVAHYVREGTALDREAADRGTSVYFPSRAVHMFPAELATGLCSLAPGVDRLVQSCLMEVDRHGRVVRYELHDGVIRSAARMTYTDVAAILTDRDKATRARYEALVPGFEMMEALFSILQGRRHRRGAVDFDLPEAEVLLDAEGRTTDIVAAERNVAHRIIEEFMLLANETVAAHLESHEMPALYRIHETPDPLKVEEFDRFVDALGYSLAAPRGQVKPRHFQRLFERIRGKAEERPVALFMLRTMQKARYDAVNYGHFGLAAPTYTHFTSPIRRYPDLVVHRLLRELRRGPVSDDRRASLDEALPDIGRHASAMERRADEAERELIQWKKVRFMADKVGDVFDGFVTGVAPFGLFVELSEHYVEGLVHISTLADDYYRYSETIQSLVGEATRKRFRLGDQVRVQVVRVDTERRQIDLGIDDVLQAVARDERKRGSARSRTRIKKEQRKGTPETRRRHRMRAGKRERAAKKGRKKKG